MGSATSRTMVERWMSEVFAQGNMATLDELLAPGFVSLDPSGRIGARGPEAFKKWLQWYRSSFIDAEWTIHEMIEEGEKVVVRYSGLTTYQGGLLNIPSRNQRVTEMGVLIFHLCEGKIQELCSALCDLELVLALGAVPVLKADEP
ncbi:MAG TPA: nuclear transport factor 2 family protein [Ktedonobacteraceae bacterium]